MKKPIYIILIAVIIILSLLLLLRDTDTEEALPTAPPTGEARREALLAQTESTMAVVYYASPDVTHLVPVTRNIKATVEVAQEALALLLSGAPATPYADSVPTGTKLLSLYTIYQTVYVDLSKEFLDIPEQQVQLAVDAICATILPLTDGFKLQILVEGEGVSSLGGVRLDEPLTEPLLNPQPMPEGLTAETAATQEYYLPAANGSYLVPHTMFLPVDSISPAARAEQVCTAILPQGMQMNGLSITDTHLTLDISLTESYACTAEYEATLLEALVRSLTSLGGVNSVSLQSNGAALEALPQGTPSASRLVYTTPVNYYDK